jgi:hypothetical protein
MDLNTVNASNPSIDQTVKIFDQFYLYEANVPAMEYDAVYSYFLTVFGTKDAAGSFTVTLFRIADQNRIPVLDMLQQLQGRNSTDITITMAYYLNSLRSSSTLLGVNSPTTPNFYAARNIKA